MTELRSEAIVFGIVERSAQAGARIAVFVPAAFGIAVASRLSLVAVLAELFAFQRGGGVSTHGVGNAGVSTEIIAGSFTVRGDGVPHAPRIGLAGVGNRVQDLASVAAGGNADGEIFARRICGTSELVHVLVTCSPASAARRIPLAEPFSLAWNVDGDGGAVSLAHVGDGVVHALAIIDATGGIKGVSDIAASVACSADLIPDAHGWEESACGLVAEFADLLALTGDGIVTAISVGIAAGLAHATSFASGLASRRSSHPFAGGDGCASTLRADASADRVAKLGGDVPEAARIRTAGVVGGITVRALLLARCLGSVPNARTSRGADVRRVDESALFAAFSAEGVPEAQGVGRARRGVGVSIGAACDADFAGVEPHATAEGGTGVDFGLVLEGRAAA